MFKFITNLLTFFFCHALSLCSLQVVDAYTGYVAITAFAVLTGIILCQSRKIKCIAFFGRCDRLHWVLAKEDMSVDHGKIIIRSGLLCDVYVLQYATMLGGSMVFLIAISVFIYIEQTKVISVCG